MYVYVVQNEQDGYVIGVFDSMDKAKGSLANLSGTYRINEWWLNGSYNTYGPPPTIVEVLAGRPVTS